MHKKRKLQLKEDNTRLELSNLSISPTVDKLTFTRKSKLKHQATKGGGNIAVAKLNEANTNTIVQDAVPKEFVAICIPPPPK